MHGSIALPLLSATDWPAEVSESETPKGSNQTNWTPLPGPQTLAFESDADIIGYGGQPGGGKTDLLVGLAARKHRRSIIFRREFPRVRAIIERSREIFASGQAHNKDSYNEQLHLWRLAGGVTIEFGSLQREQDKNNYQGRAYDLHGFDELTEFSETQFRFVIGWNRSAVLGQHAQVVCTFNPPLTEDGTWVIRFFGPWLDPDYDGPKAGPGELVWFITNPNGADQEVGRGDTRPESHPLAKSRTFIPATLADNPYLLASGYEATLQALPEPIRSILIGKAPPIGTTDHPWQVIPAAWIAAARQRWRDGNHGPQTSAGMDVARGGSDRTIVARLHGNWLAPLQVVPGAQTATGPDAARLILPDALAGVPIGVDVIGIGASAYDSARSLGHTTVAGINNSSAAKDSAGQPYTDRTGRLRFRNIRALAYWRVREALDPAGDVLLALPDDDELAKELRAPRWSLTPYGIQVESKDDIIERLGRSPDKADALTIAVVAPLFAGASWLLWE